MLYITNPRPLINETLSIVIENDTLTLIDRAGETIAWANDTYCLFDYARVMGANLV